MKADVMTLDASSAGSVELSDGLFALEPRKDILQRMVRYQLSKRQARTHKAKGRSEVNGPNKKIYKQKGTVQARHGNDKPPQFRGGGRAFGPVPRSHAHDLPKKVRVLALKHALSSKAQSNALIVLDKASYRSRKRRNSAASSSDWAFRMRSSSTARRCKTILRSPRVTSRMWMCCRSRASTFTTFCAARSSC